MRTRTVEDVHRLIDVARNWVSPGLIVNVEDEAKLPDQLPPSAIAAVLLNREWKRDVAISSPGWLYNDVNWRPLSMFPMLLQFFPAEVPSLTGKLDDCIKHAHDLGLRYVLPTFGAYGNPKPTPSWYPLNMRHSLYTGDDVGPGNWHKWKAT